MWIWLVGKFFYPVENIWFGQSYLIGVNEIIVVSPFDLLATPGCHQERLLNKFKSLFLGYLDELW